LRKIIMPRSKRARLVPLTQTKKRTTREHKSSYIEQVREAIDKHDSVYLFSFENMRSTKFKQVRQHFASTGRIFLGKNKLLQIALGRTPEEEYQENLRHVSKRIEGGSVGLLLTSEPEEKVSEYFATSVEPDYARAGTIATEDVTVSNEKLYQYPVSMMEQFRKLGMPVEIQNGKIVLYQRENGEMDGYRICKEGQILTAEKCKLLVHFEIKLAKFSVQLVCRWKKGGEFEVINEDTDMRG